jgi:hypothetical protein
MNSIALCQESLNEFTGVLTHSPMSLNSLMVGKEGSAVANTTDQTFQGPGGLDRIRLDAAQQSCPGLACLTGVGGRRVSTCSQAASAELVCMSGTPVRKSLCTWVRQVQTVFAKLGQLFMSTMLMLMTWFRKALVIICARGGCPCIPLITFEMGLACCGCRLKLGGATLLHSCVASGAGFINSAAERAGAD